MSASGADNGKMKIFSGRHTKALAKRVCVGRGERALDRQKHGMQKGALALKHARHEGAEWRRAECDEGKEDGDLQPTDEGHGNPGLEIFRTDERVEQVTCHDQRYAPPECEFEHARLPSDARAQAQVEPHRAEERGGGGEHEKIRGGHG